jgi:hypothetical protein
MGACLSPELLLAAGLGIALVLVGVALLVKVTFP